jgi:hypothetical protein
LNVSRYQTSSAQRTWPLSQGGDHSAARDRPGPPDGRGPAAQLAERRRRAHDLDRLDDALGWICRRHSLTRRRRDGLPARSISPRRPRRAAGPRSPTRRTRGTDPRRRSLRGAPRAPAPARAGARRCSTRRGARIAWRDGIR